MATTSVQEGVSWRERSGKWELLTGMNLHVGASWRGYQEELSNEYGRTRERLLASKRTGGSLMERNYNRESLLARLSREG